MQTIYATSRHRPREPRLDNQPRWLAPAVAAAVLEIGDLAPRLAGLLQVAAIPDRTVKAVLDWSELVADADAGSPFSLDRLRTVLPALVTAFVGAHTYSQAGPGEDGDRCVDLHDQGCGGLVGAVMSRLELIAAELYGEAGRRLAEATRGALADDLDRITAMVLGR